MQREIFEQWDSVTGDELSGTPPPTDGIPFGILHVREAGFGIRDVDACHAPIR
jgi:hypothetical protein